MQCPKCNGEMYDNTKTKKTPKHPDYVCKDKDNCGHAVWLPKEKKETVAPAGEFLCEVCGKPMKDGKYKKHYACNKPTIKKPLSIKEVAVTAPLPTENNIKQYTGDKVPRSMYGAWAANLTIAMINAKEIIKQEEIMTAYEYFVNNADWVLNGTVSNAPSNPILDKSQPKVNVPAPVKKEPPKTDPTGTEEFNLDDINFNL